MISAKYIKENAVRKFDDIKSFLYDSKDNVREIYEVIEDEVNSDADLSQLNSSSKTAIWRLWIYIIAMISFIQESLWIDFRGQLERAARFAQPHTRAWYAQRCLEFQLGDTLIVSNGAVIYSPIIEANRIITASAVTELISGTLLIKVAKSNAADDGYEALSNTELMAFESYLNSIKDAGVATSVISRNPDEIRIFADIYFDPIYSDADVLQNIENAVSDYIKNLDFKGEYRTIKMIDVIQAIPGIIDVDVDSTDATPSYTGVATWSPVDLTYLSKAGHMIISPSHPFSSSLNLIPTNV